MIKSFLVLISSNFIIASSDVNKNKGVAEMVPFNVANGILWVFRWPSGYHVGLSPMRPGFDSRLGMADPGAVSEKGFVPV